MGSDLSRQLKKLDQISRMLATTTSLKEVKGVRDQAEAIRVLAKSVQANLEIQNQAAKGKLQAERRAGVLLTDIVPHGGDRKKSQNNSKATLAELGINSNQSALAGREAAVPEAVFERYVAEANQKGNEITSAGLLRVAKSVNGKTRQSRVGRRPASSTFDGAITCVSNGKPHDGLDNPILECRQLFEDLKGHRNLLEEVWAGGKGASMDKGQLRLVTRVLAEMGGFLDSLEQSVIGKSSMAKC